MWLLLTESMNSSNQVYLPVTHSHLHVKNTGLSDLSEIIVENGQKTTINEAQRVRTVILKEEWYSKRQDFVKFSC